MLAARTGVTRGAHLDVPIAQTKLRLGWNLEGDDGYGGGVNATASFGRWDSLPAVAATLSEQRADEVIVAGQREVNSAVTGVGDEGVDAVALGVL